MTKTTCRQVDEARNVILKQILTPEAKERRNLKNEAKQ